MNIYVGNVSYDLTDHELRDLFESHGKTISASIIKDRETGRSKGFGFIDMENESDGENAIKELDGQEIHGRNIKVNQARARTNEGSNQRQRDW